MSPGARSSKRGKVIKRTALLLSSLLVLLLLAAAGLVFIDPPFSERTVLIIDEVVQSALPELITGETGMAQSGDIELWYESRQVGDSSRGAVLFINGWAEPSTFWPPHLIQTVADSGYQVIRFDNRSLGMSDWMQNWNPDSAYSLIDMADDALAILDHLQIEKAHLVGYSMGGYIAQRLALRYPERVRSLTCLSSSGHLADPGHPEFELQNDVKRLGIRSSLVRNLTNFSKLFIKIGESMNYGSPDTFDVRSRLQRGLYEIKRRRGFNSNARRHHGAAAGTADPNYAVLPRLSVPTLIVHGRKDALLSFQLAQEYAELIPGSRRVWLTTSGHMLTPEYLREMMPALFAHFRPGAR